MRKIDININQAEIINISIEFDSKNNNTYISAILALYAGSQQVSTFTISTRSWVAEPNKFTFPASLIEPINHIQSILEGIATGLCRSATKELPEHSQGDAEDEDDLPF